MANLEYLAITTNTDMDESLDLTYDHYMEIAESYFKACPSLEYVFLHPPEAHFLPELRANGELVGVRPILPSDCEDDMHWAEEPDFDPVLRFDSRGWPVELQISGF